MNLLLDSHVLLWWLDGSPRLSRDIGDVIGDPQKNVFISAATTWELAIKRTLGRLAVTTDDLNRVFTSGYAEKLDVTVDHGFAIADLPPHHRDPFDRMLVAQARSEGLTLVTHDRALKPYDVPILWA